MRVSTPEILLVSISYVGLRVTLEVGGSSKPAYVVGTREVTEDKQYLQFNFERKENRWYSTLEEAGDVFTKLTNGQAIPEELKGKTLGEMEEVVLA